MPIRPYFGALLRALLIPGRRPGRRLVPILVLLLSLGAGAARALPPLENNSRVMEELVAGEIAYQIQKHCPAISGRKLLAIGKLNQLASYARSLGYTDADFRALTKNGAARDKRDALVNAYLAKMGVVPGDAESYCTLGRAEIEKGTLIGSLLRMK
jgi:Family of unknown function (DUF5333)